MKRTYYIDYPQEQLEGQANNYRCAYCKVVTTKINGSLQGHLPHCEYRLKLEQEGFENNENPSPPSCSVADDYG